MFEQAHEQREICSNKQTNKQTNKQLFLLSLSSSVDVGRMMIVPSGEGMDVGGSMMTLMIAVIF